MWACKATSKELKSPFQMFPRAACNNAAFRSLPERLWVHTVSRRLNKSPFCPEVWGRMNMTFMEDSLLSLHYPPWCKISFLSLSFTLVGRRMVSPLSKHTKYFPWALVPGFLWLYEEPPTNIPKESGLLFVVCADSFIHVTNIHHLIYSRHWFFTI